MRSRFFFIGMGFMVLSVVSMQGEAAAAQEHTQGMQAAASASQTQAPAVSKETCLNCHGPFDKIIDASGSYVAPSGEKTSPHRYVPHDSKQEADIPECTNCHTVHSLDPLPVQGTVDLKKVGVQWCYEACHHEKNLTSCKECHP